MKIFSQTRLINLLLLIGMIILPVCGVLAYQQIQQLVEANSWVVHTHKVIEAADLTLLNITRAESLVNYYGITNNKTLTQDLPAYTNSATKDIHLLRYLTQDNPIQEVRINELESLVNTKISLLNQISQIDNVKNNPAGLQLMTSEERQKLKVDLNRTVAEIIQEENNLLEQRNIAATHQTNLSNVMYLIFEIASEIFLIVSFVLLNYNFYQRKIAERKQTTAEKNLLLSNKHLQESEERLLLASEGSAAGLWDWDITTDQVFYSSYYKKMLGYAENEFPNTLDAFERILHPNDLDKVWEAIEQHLDNRVPFRVEYRLRSKSGDYNWYQAAGQALWNKNGVPIRMAGSTIDIAERKKADQRLNIQYAVAEILSEGLTLEEISIKIIKKICEELGWELGAIWKVDDEKILLSCIGVWHSSEPGLQALEDDTRKAQFKYGEGLPGLVWKKGKPMWFADFKQDPRFPRIEIIKEIGLHSAFCFPIMVRKKVLGVIECFTKDEESADRSNVDPILTIGAQIGQFLRRKIVEDDLKQSEGYKTAILESALDSIITINEENKIVSFNSQTMKAFQYRKDELQDKNINIILPNYDLNKKEPSDKPDLEIQGLRKNEELFPVEIKISRMNLENQNMSVIIVRDVTERKKVEKIKNEFVSVVSHELRTPLTSIRGALGLVLGGATGTFPEKVKKLLVLANNNCERLLLLINDILDIERIEAGKMNFEFQIIDINHLVSEAVAANKLYADKYDVTLKFTESEPQKINVDPGRLMQVLTNLISNAVKFSPKGEEVILTIKLRQEKVRVLVSNKGPGIPTDFQLHIFQKFSQADTSDTRGKGGSGLGLNISKAIIEKLGGTLNFISKPDEITTFYFDLPLWQETQKIIDLQKNNANSAHHQNRILICEDDEDQASYIGTLLEAVGYPVDISHTVSEAKKLLEKETYHVLLLDLILPDQDGITFIRELRSIEKTRMLPIIVISVIAQTGRSLLNGGAFSVVDWLEKPVDFNKLLKTLMDTKMKIHPKIPTILHVEDDPDTAKVMQTLLEEHANVVSAATIQETIEKLKQMKFDLVILDLLLPDGNAEKILPLISEYKLPVIVYSAIELNKQFAKYVSHSLVKSETSYDQLLNLISHVIETGS